MWGSSLQAVAAVAAARLLTSLGFHRWSAGEQVLAFSARLWSMGGVGERWAPGENQNALWHPAGITTLWL